MANSTLKEIRTLLENQIDSGETSVDTDPTSTILDTYINNAIRKIVRKDRPRELYSAAVSTAGITINTNTVSLPSDVFIPDLVYYENSSGTVVPLLQKGVKEMIDIQGSNSFFDTTNTGDPTYYDVKGTSLLFNKYFSRTDTDAIKIYGMGFPTTLTAALETTTQTELPIDYDLLISYEAAILFYQKDDDFENQRKFEILAKQERDDHRTFLRTNDSSAIELDPNHYLGKGQNALNNPNIFFGV